MTDARNNKTGRLARAAESALSALADELARRLVIAAGRVEALDRHYTPLARKVCAGTATAEEEDRSIRLSGVMESARRIADALSEDRQGVARALSAVEEVREAHTTLSLVNRWTR